MDATTPAHPSWIKDGAHTGDEVLLLVVCPQALLPARAALVARLAAFMSACARGVNNVGHDISGGIIDVQKRRILLGGLRTGNLNQ